MPEGPLNPRDLRFYFALSQIPLEVLVVIGVGLGLDYLFDTRPWATIIAAFVGLAVGFSHMIALLVRIGRAGSSEKKQDNQ